jgi:hypothetical protein
MPLYIQLIELLKTEYIYVHQLPKEYKYSLGDEIVKISWKIMDSFIIAQTCGRNNEQKRSEILKINQLFDSLKLRIRFLTELKLISLKQTSYLNEQLVSIGKMVGNWQKNV